MSEFSAADVLRARQELAGRDLKWFARLIDIPGAPVSDNPDEDKFHTFRCEHHPAHVDLMLTALQAVADGKCPNLMMFLPPGSAKSTYTSVVFNAWALARSRRRPHILTSYATQLTRKHGRRARQLIRSPGFQSLFPGLTLAKDAEDEWGLSNESGCMSAGILAGITGNRGSVIVDDPVAGRDEAESATIRKKTREAWEDDLCTRPRPRVDYRIIIQTRWHEDDLAGGILPAGWKGESGPITGRDGRLWLVLRLPAKCDRPDDPLGRSIGEYLWPDYMGAAHFGQFESNPRTWNSLFQAIPTPDEGTYFKREWFRRYQTPPANLRRLITSDYAVTDEGGDWTVHAVWGIDSDSNIYLLASWRERTAPDKWIDALLGLEKHWNPERTIGEGGVIEKSVKPLMIRMRAEQNRWTHTEWLSSPQDKPTRARSFQGRASAGKVFLPEGALGEEWLDEFIRFPNGSTDDRVDCAGLLGRVLDRAMPAAQPTPTPAPQKVLSVGKTPQGFEGLTLNDLWEQMENNAGGRNRI